MIRRLTDQFIKNLPPPPPGTRKRLLVLDTVVRCFGVRAGKFRKSFVLTDRHDGNKYPSLRVFGQYPEMTLEQAREEAVRLKHQIKKERIEIKKFEKETRNEHKRLNHSLLLRVANKIGTFRQQKIKPICFLYRHFSHNGDLLYVGISGDTIRRRISRRPRRRRALLVPALIHAPITPIGILRAPVEHAMGRS